MALIFKDNLQTFHTSGLYTLRGFVNNTWHDVYTIAGTHTGNIAVDAPHYYITVDTDLYLPGNSYLFKWVDMNGVESNETLITIPVSEDLLQQDGSYILQQDGNRIIVW